MTDSAERAEGEMIMTDVAFEEDVVTQIARHMNGDHAGDNVLIVRVLGGHPEATAARMSGMDADALGFGATVNVIVVPVRVPFRVRLTERAQVRTEAVRMYQES